MRQTSAREVVTLLKISGIFGFALSLGGIFLQVFLFTLGGFRAVAEYNLISVCFVVIFYLISGWLLARMTSKKLLLLGIAAHILLFSLLFLFREQSLVLLVALGIINGIAMGTFWAAMNLFHYIVTTDEMRHTFFGRQNFLFSVTGGIAPILGGMIISIGGLLVSKDFGYSIMFFLIALLMAVLYREAKKLPDSEAMMFSIFDMMHHRRSRVWKLVLIQDFFYGVFDFLFPALIAVITYLVVKEEIILGVVNASGAIVAACAALAARMILARKRTSFIAIALVAALGIGLFAAEQNWWGLLALTFLFNAAMPILNVATSKTFFDILDRSDDPQNKKYYLFLEREMVLGAGRIASLLIFFLVLNDANQYEIMRVGVAVLAVVPLCIGLVLRRVMQRMQAG